MGDVVDINLRKRLEADPMYAVIPESTIASLERYINNYIPPGGFLKAVLQNDLYRAVTRSDLQNRKAIPAIVYFLANQCPSACWGSTEAYDDWLMKRTM